MSKPRQVNYFRAVLPTAKPHIVKMATHGRFAYGCKQRGVMGIGYGHTPHEAAFRLHPGAAR
jgi:hypothetical protein